LIKVTRRLRSWSPSVETIPARVVEICPVLVVEICPVLVVEICPVLVVEICPVLVVEICPVLVVEICPDFEVANVVADKAVTNSVVQITDLRFFIVLLL
jgi:hypothetical protein